MIALWRLAVCVVAGVMASCAAPLPKYPPMERGAALALMKERDARITSLQSTATVTVRDVGGSSMSLDAAIAAEWPDRLRLRAWKFGHPAMDLTLTPEGLWMYIPEEARQKAGGREFSVSREQLARVWRLMGPNVLGEGAQIVREDGAVMVARREVDPGDAGSAVLEFDIDRETLTVRECRFMDSTGRVRQTLKLESYRVVPLGAETTVWPMRMSATGEYGSLVIRFSTPDFNGQVPAEAFIPPRRAVKQP